MFSHLPVLQLSIAFTRALKGKGCIENPLQHYFDFSSGRLRMPDRVDSGEPEVPSTWREIYFETPGFKEQNFLMQLGFCALGLEMIGLIVLWTGYRKKERWAWFVMLIILLFFVFPLNVLKLLLDMQTPSFEWSAWFRGIREGYPPSIGLAVGVLNFLVMLVALLLPIKAFFFHRPEGSG